MNTTGTFSPFYFVDHFYRMKKIWKSVIIIFVAIITIPLIFFILAHSGAFGHLQTKEELRNFRNAEASKVLSSEGLLIGKFYSENRTNVKFEQLPAYLVNALIATEDVRFFEHEGVDSRSLIRVLLKTVLINPVSPPGIDRFTIFIVHK